MKLPRVRFTVRRMMLAVAIVAVATGGWRALMGRAERLRRLASEHESRTAVVWLERLGKGILLPWGFDADGERVSKPVNDWHEAMAAKYEGASRQPWLPIAADPPMPPDPPEPE